MSFVQPLVRLALAVAAGAAFVLAPASAATIVIGGGNVVDGSGRMVEEARAVAPFSRVVVNGPVDVVLKRGAAEKAVVHADDNIAPLIDVRVDAGKLVVETRKDASFRTRNKVFVSVDFKQVDGLQLNGSGDVTIDDVKTGLFEAAIRGSGNVNVGRVEASTVAVSISGSGDVTVSGSAEKAGLVIEGSGNIIAGDLKAKSVGIRISGSGDASVCASETLQVRIAGSGDVTYCGSPRIEKKISGSGELIRVR